MCMPSAPKPPPPPPPVPPPQETKTPDVTEFQRSKKKQSAMAGGTLLTSPSGIDLAAQNTGSTYLGG